MAVTVTIKDESGSGRDAAVMVDAVMQVLRGPLWWEVEIRKLPEVQAILTAPDALRRACILQTAAEAPARGTIQLLAVIARRRAGLSLEDIETVLLGLDSQDSNRASSLMTVLIGQVEATWAGLHPRGRDQLREQLTRIAAHLPNHPSSTRLHKLIDTSANNRS